MSAPTIILNVIGDEIDVEYKRPVSFKLNAAFESETARMKTMLGMDFKGVALYRCEGEKPDVRPTVPFSWKSTPSKEKFKRGDFIYLKEADLDRQRKDTEFQAALEDFRKERGYHGPQPGLSDVDEFKEELSSKLNAVASRDLCKFEKEKRDGIEADEFRSHRDITIEFREKQELKNKEAELRKRIEDEAQGTIDAAYRTLIVTPRVKKLLAEVCAAEPPQRQAIVSEEDTARAATRSEANVAKQLLDLQEAKRNMEQESQRQAEAARQQQELMLAAAHEQKQTSSAGGGGGGQLSGEQMAQLAQMFAAGGGVGPSDPGVTKLLQNIEARLNVQDVRATELMRSMMQAHNDAMERMLLVTKQNEDEITAKHRRQMDDFDRAAKRAAYSAVLTQAETEAVAKLLSEQNDILEKLVALVEGRIAPTSNVVNKVHESALSTAVASIADMQARLAESMLHLENSRLAAQKRMEELEQSARQRSASESLKATPIATAVNDTTTTHAGLVTSSEAEHFTSPAAAGVICLSGTQWRLGHREGIRRVMAAVAHKYELPLRSGYGATLEGAFDLVDAVLAQCGGSAWDAVDCIAEHTQIETLRHDVPFKRLGAVCDTHAPAFRCVLPLLMDLYSGREAELCDTLMTLGLRSDAVAAASLTNPSEPPTLSKSVRYLAVRDAETGELRFAHPIVDDITQVLRPFAQGG